MEKIPDSILEQLEYWETRRKATSVSEIETLYVGLLLGTEKTLITLGYDITKLPNISPLFKNSFSRANGKQ